MAEMLAALPLGGIIDCPFGTGRWNSFYDAGNRHVLGIDLSDDMLKQAKTKISPDHFSNNDLWRGSVFDLSRQISEKDAKGLCCISCILFLNWIGFVSLERVDIEKKNLNLDHAIFGISLDREDEGTLRRLYRKSRLAYVNFRVTQQPDQQVRSERAFKRLLDIYGFNILEQAFIFANPSRKNYLFFC